MDNIWRLVRPYNYHLVKERFVTILYIFRVYDQTCLRRVTWSSRKYVATTRISSRICSPWNFFMSSINLTSWTIIYTTWKHQENNILRNVFLNSYCISTWLSLTVNLPWSIFSPLLRRPFFLRVVERMPEYCRSLSTFLDHRSRFFRWRVWTWSPAYNLDILLYPRDPDSVATSLDRWRTWICCSSVADIGRRSSGKTRGSWNRRCTWPCSRSPENVGEDERSFIP
jgi:hypothetical protein